MYAIGFVGASRAFELSHFAALFTHAAQLLCGVWV